MIIKFEIQYITLPGQSLQIMIGDGSVFDMNFVAGEVWRLDIDIPKQTSEISYYYRVVTNGVEVDREWSGLPHVVRFSQNDGCYVYELRDRWQYMPRNRGMYSSAFVDCFFSRRAVSSVSVDAVVGGTHGGDVVTFEVYAPEVTPLETVVLVGASEALGAWDPARGVVMSGARFPLWDVTLEGGELRGDACSLAIEYKFVIVYGSGAESVVWEAGENRVLELPELGTICNGDDRDLVCHRMERGMHLRVQSTWRGAGVAVPVFSLRSAQSWGIGEFTDLELMVQWAAATGQCVVQLLPINDTTDTHTFLDSYPYNAVSCDALHPIYLSPIKMGALVGRGRMEYYMTRAEELNALAELDYTAVEALKWKYFRELYAQDGDMVLKDAEFQAFFKVNRVWLEPYALFCCLRDHYGTADHRQWGEWSVWDAGLPGRLYSIDNFVDGGVWSESMFHVYLQYHLHRQLCAVADMARRSGVVLKGDIAIGVSHNSVETWRNPELFHLNAQAGAPPDDFAVIGQNWGFPTYNWEQMAMDGYGWWRGRMQRMGRYFDMYRVDHILGFFRIWQIPVSQVQGIMGQFSPAMPLSREELSLRWGLPMLEQRYLTPYVHKSRLEEIFGNHLAAADRYLVEVGEDFYTLHPLCDTQRKVADLFARDTSVQGRALCDGLTEICAEVLFVRDMEDSELFHPRIGVQNSRSYEFLFPWEKERFDELYTHYFYHRHNDFWAEQAMRVLPTLIDSSRMLCCVEDLGMIPNCVPGVLEHLRVLTLEIQRMPKSAASVFGDTTRYHYLSVCTTATHDMSPLREWWAELSQSMREIYYREILHHNIAETVPLVADTALCHEIVMLHMDAPSQFAILPLQDWMSIDGSIVPPPAGISQRINVPANPQNYWRYRMHITLEELLMHTSLPASR